MCREGFYRLPFCTVGYQYRKDIKFVMNLNRIAENFTHLDIPICTVNCPSNPIFPNPFIPTNTNNSLLQNVNDLIWVGEM